jgi:hypothetical protein
VAVVKQYRTGTFKKHKFFVGISKATDAKNRILIVIRNPVVRMRGSGLYQNVTDPGHCFYKNLFTARVHLNAFTFLNIFLGTDSRAIGRTFFCVPEPVREFAPVSSS